MESTASTCPAPASPSRPGGEYRPSLELKSLIVDKIAEGRPIRWRNRDVRRISPMRAMSLVSREFAVLAEPYLWSHFHFERVGPQDLRHVLAHTLPHHGQHVKRLGMTQFDCRPIVPLPPTTEDSDPDSAPPSARHDPVLASALYGLLVRAIGGMPRLYEVALPASFFGDMSDARGGRQWGWITSTPDLSVAGVLTALGTRLSSLRFGDDWAGAYDSQGSIGRRLGTFLSGFPPLTHLSLNIRVPGPKEREGTRSRSEAPLIRGSDRGEYPGDGLKDS